MRGVIGRVVDRILSLTKIILPMYHQALHSHNLFTTGMWSMVACQDLKDNIISMLSLSSNCGFLQEKQSLARAPEESR